MQREEITSAVIEIVETSKIIDIHTHLFPGSFNELCLWGPDELLTYHYLVAEVLRVTGLSAFEFHEMKKPEQADFIYKNLFVERTPLSEACRGVVTVFNELGIDLSDKTLESARKKYKELTIDTFTELVFEKSGLTDLVMTNDPFDECENNIWKDKKEHDKRFKSALRLDSLLNNYNSARYKLNEMGYEVGRTLNGIAKREIRRFLTDSVKNIDALYMAVSMPPVFKLPDDDTVAILLEDCVLPVAFDMNLPLALMIGVKRGVNADLVLAGDGVGKSSIESVEYLCRKFYRNKFMITMLSRENQHELCVTARKFPNLFLFGCWWFLNTPSLIEEITRMRIELLGTSFMPQHSDARILDQLIYKWKHSRSIISKVLIEKYTDLQDSGWNVEREAIEKDVDNLLRNNFLEFLKLEL